MSTTSLAPFSTVSECRSLVALVFAPLVVVLVLVLATLILTSPFSAGQWLWYYCARVGLRLIFFTTPPTMAQIGMLPPLTRIAAFVEYTGRFAKEGYGAIYVTAVVEDYFLGQFYSGQIGVAEFLEHMRVKVGHAADLPMRRKRYSKCDFRQTHFWLFCFRPHQRKVTECMCHLKKLGGFGEVVACMRGMLDALSESDVPREDLGDAWLASLQA
ncbi:hypothetical protein B0H10DRAFT_2239242 [Mycena sp. CBHHK59/15]|nr:hypothetical protein B0H10DRAFT_2239242 [Mycena sp. CBHHK59/15]